MVPGYVYFVTLEFGSLRRVADTQSDNAAFVSMSWFRDGDPLIPNTAAPDLTHCLAAEQGACISWPGDYVLTSGPISRGRNGPTNRQIWSRCMKKTVSFGNTTRLSIVVMASFWRTTTRPALANKASSDSFTERMMTR